MKIPSRFYRLTVLWCLAWATTTICAISGFAETLVRTPFGPFPAECIFEHPPGTALDISGGVTRTVHPSFGRRTHDPNPTCIGHLDRLKNPQNSPITHGPNLPSGWLASVKADMPVEVGAMHAVYTVPQTPLADGQTLYYFIGAQDKYWWPQTILQPVLAYGGQAPGWNLSSWYCCVRGEVHHSPFLIGLKPGDKIEAAIVKTKSKSGTYDVRAAWNDQTTTLSAHVGKQTFRQITAALEVYDVDRCEQLSPTAMTFTGIEITRPNGTVMLPDWTQEPPAGRAACDTIISSNSGWYVSIGPSP